MSVFLLVSPLLLVITLCLVILVVALGFVVYIFNLLQSVLKRHTTSSIFIKISNKIAQRYLRNIPLLFPSFSLVSYYEFLGPLVALVKPFSSLGAKSPDP